MKQETISLNITHAIEGIYPKHVEGLFMLEINDTVESEINYMLDEVSVLLCLDGYGTLKINEKEYKIEPNLIIFIPPNYIVRNTEENNHYNIKTLFFSTDLAVSLIIAEDYQVAAEIRKRSCIKVSEESMKELVLYYDFLKNESEKQSTIFKVQVIKTLLLAYLIKIGEAYALSEFHNNDQPRTRAVAITEQFIELVSLHFKEERKLAFYADKMCISIKYLSYTIKNVTNKSAISWINESVIQKIKQLLKTTDLSISEIADDLKFPNASFFGRYFKDHTHMTPNEFRKS